jgi:uncharacterized protein
MLLAYGAKNFCCFKDWLEIDLSLNSKVPKEISNGLPATKAICIKGPNAAGKTNALKAISFLGYFCTNSFSAKPEADIPIDSFFGCPDPCEFFVKFVIDGIEYTYELLATKKEVISEKIFRTEKRKTLVFHRERTKIAKNTLFAKPDTITDRINASSISVAKQYLIPEFVPFYNFFNSIRFNVSKTGLIKNWLNEDAILALYKNNPSSFEFTKNLLKAFDTGIEDVKIRNRSIKNDEERLVPIFEYNIDGKVEELERVSQSSGTVVLFSLLAAYFATLDEGGILVLDEFDVYLHPDILPHLVRLFTEVSSNPKNAQLIFSTHNTDIIDMMGKYRTVFLGKEKGKCFSYRLDELNETLLRNDRPITPIYKTGQIGGVPRI